MKVACIGLGIMGSRMAANLLKAGHALSVHNRTRAKADGLVAQGATWADSPAAAVAGAEALVTVLSEPAAVAEMAGGALGFLAALPSGALWVESSTVNPSFAREMAGAAEARGLRYLDAPVSGTRGPAEKGELAFVVGGDPAHLEAARPLLDAMGNTITHVGGVGMGAAMKMVRNLLLGQGLLAFAEALLLGESLGIARETLLETLLGGNMTPAFLAGKKPKFAGESFEPDFPLRWMHKDLQLVNRTAYEQGIALPGAAAAQSAYGLADRAGLGGLDFSAVYRFLKDPGKGD